MPVSGNAALQQQYEAELVAYGATNYPEVFGLQTNGLDGRPVALTNTDIPRPWQVVSNYSAQIFVGFQTRAPPNLSDNNRDDTNYTAANLLIFRAALTKAVLQRGDFMKIYAVDADDPSWCNGVRTAHIRWSLPPAPAHLTVGLTNGAVSLTLAGTVSAIYRV